MQRLIADDLAGARLPRPDRNVTDTLMGTIFVVMPNIFNGNMAQAILREKDHVIQAFVLDRANKAFGVRIHIRSVDDGLRQLRAQNAFGALPVLSVVVENSMSASGKRLAGHGGRPQDSCAPRIRGMAGNAKQMHAAGIVFDRDEDKRVDHFAQQANRDLDKICTHGGMGMQLPELTPGTALASVSGRGCTAMLSQDFANGRFGNGESTLGHLANDARQPGAPFVVNAQNGVDFVLPKPRSSRTSFRVRFSRAVRHALLESFHGANKRSGCGDPVKDLPQTNRNTLQIRDVQRPLGRGPAQPFSPERGARNLHLLIDRREKIIDRQTQCRPAGHPQRHADAEWLFAGGAHRIGGFGGWDFGHRGGTIHERRDATSAGLFAETLFHDNS